MCIRTAFVKGVIDPVNSFRDGKISVSKLEASVAQAPQLLTKELEQTRTLGKDVSFLLLVSSGLTNPNGKRISPQKNQQIKTIATKIVKDVVIYTGKRLLKNGQTVSNKQKKEMARTIQSLLPDADEKIRLHLVKLDGAIKIASTIHQLKK